MCDEDQTGDLSRIGKVWGEKMYEERIQQIYISDDSLIFPSLPIPINYVTKRFQLRPLTITKASFTLEGKLGSKRERKRLILMIIHNSSNCQS